jgi:predicted transport protein
MMKLFGLKNDTLTAISSKDFKLEKDIQNLVEKNLEELFHLQFVKSEFQIKDFRIDTLGFNKENKSFVIIEYKKERNFSVIDQGYTYLSLMLNNKSDFILEYNENCNEKLKRNDVDWTQSRVIFISTQFTEYQKHSVNFRDVPFDLWEIKRYDNDTLGFLQHKTTSRESISTTSTDSGSVISHVSKEIKVYTEEDHLKRSKNRPEWVNELYLSLKDRILNLGEVEIVYRGDRITFKRENPVVDIVVHNKGLYVIINLMAGELNDPNNLSKKYDTKRHWGNGDYYIPVDNTTDLDYVMFVINQSYKNQESK